MKVPKHYTSKAFVKTLLAQNLKHITQSKKPYRITADIFICVWSVKKKKKNAYNKR